MKNISSPSGAHAKVHGSPGSRVRLLGLGRSLWPLVLVFIALGYLIRTAVPIPAISTSVAGLLFLALAVAVAAATNYSRDRLGNYLKGARGEEAVARALDRLPADWHVFHGVALDNTPLSTGGGADIDHVVIAPNAIFVIETKNWSGAITATHDTLLCDGLPPDRDPLEQAKAAASGLRQRLAEETSEKVAAAPPVIPIVCFCGGTRPRGITGLAGVMICNEEGLCAMMQAHRGAKLPLEYRNTALKVLKAAVEK
jgi:hypothetical protein